MNAKSPSFSRQGWYLRAGKVDYGRALAWQRSLVKMRREGLARDTIILVEHPPVITVGKDGHIENYEQCDIPPVKIERGGDVTYHGPGQIVAYFIFNLTRRGRDVRKFMEDIQQGIIRLLAEFGLEGKMSEEFTGVWVDNKKIASLGVAVKQWISFHGMALNINTDMRKFRQINPCGLSADDMISLSKITGKKHNLKALEMKLLKHYSDVFETRFTPIELAELAEELESQSGAGTI